MLTFGRLNVNHAMQRANSTVALGPRKTMDNLNRVGWWQHIPDAKWLLASGKGTKEDIP
jgi:hypothetical protein